jgi:ATP-dependent Lon protease
MANEESNNNQDQQEPILSEESVKDSGKNSGNSGDANDSAVKASLNGDSGSDTGEDSNSDSGSGENQSSDSGSGESQSSDSGSGESQSSDSSSNSDGSGNERKTVHPSARKTSIDTNVMAAALVDPLETLPERVFVIPVYGRPFVPGQILPVQIAAKPWQKTIEMVLKTSHKTLALFCIPSDEDTPEVRSDLMSSDDILKSIPKTGCLIRILHARINDSDIQFIAEGISRVNITKIMDAAKPPYCADVSYPEDQNSSKATKLELKAHSMAIMNGIKELIPLNPMYSEEIKQYTAKFNPNHPSVLADCAAGITTATGVELQKVLDTYDILERLKCTYELIQKEVQIAKLQSDIKASVDEKVQKRQRDYYLNEQLKEIKKELGLTIDDKTVEITKFEEKMAKFKPSDEVKEKFQEEINKLKVLEQGSPEYAITRNHIEWMTNIPWGVYTPETLDIKHTRKVLDEDHDAIVDVKERIVEFVAVGSKRGEVNGSIILFVGPPGVGKTSVGKSIARALNRPFYRFSVGGLHDEAEIKGHRRTYIGALPGKLIQALKQSKCMNPVIMLDEIDKLTNSHVGDPSAALLEALDPEQNSEFLDHYMDVRVDLSKCLFICTANSTDGIPAPLLDRMDVISLSGYLSAEKLQIAKHHLIPKVIEKAGLKKNEIKITDAAVKAMIEDYAREAGVRHLEKLISKLVRKSVVKMIDENIESVTIKPEDLHEYLKSPLFREDEHLKGVGIATGLAWTSMGGATIPIEAITLNNLGASLQLTGSLGDVMKESASLAYSYVVANIGKFEPKKKHYFDKAKIHLHVPEGATPKDGPSAGVTMATALLSLALNKAPAKGYAMTGELTLTGKVLAIGGIREKSLAAKRLNIKKLICPKANESDVNDLPEFVKKGIEYHFVETYEDVAKILFPTLFKK